MRAAPFLPYGTRRAPAALAEAGADGKPDGVMVALMLNTTANSAATDALAKVATEPRDNLHITLAYCGKTAELTAAQIAALRATVTTVAATYAPLTGAVSGIGRFPASETSDGKDVYYAKPALPSLTALRETIVARLRAAGVPVSDKHSFTPHMTLAYRETDATTPAITVPHVPLRFDAVTVVVGDERTVAPLSAMGDKGGPARLQESAMSVMPYVPARMRTPHR